MSDRFHVLASEPLPNRDMWRVEIERRGRRGVALVPTGLVVEYGWGHDMREDVARYVEVIGLRGCQLIEGPL